MFSAIALLILLIACINFMNLSTARSAKRAKEVGLRKVVGAYRRQLVYQFLGESVIITFLALILSVGLVQLANPVFKSLFVNRIIFDYHQSWAFYMQLVGVAIITGIFSGSYPAFFLSSYRPVETLKGTKVSSGGSGSAALRKILVIGQFAITIALIICTGIIQQQMDFVRQKDLGYNKDQVVYVPLRSQESLDKLPVLKTDMAKNSRVVNVSASAGLRGAAGSNGIMNLAGTDQPVQLMMRHSFVDFDLIETMEMEMVEGRSFSRSFASDTVNSVVVNEATVRKLGWDDPIGQEFQGSGEGPNYSVIGVVKDFHFFSLHTEIEPLIMWLAPYRARYMMVRLETQDIQESLAFIENTWKTFIPDFPFEYGFLDAHFERLYRTDQNTGKLFSSFALITIMIACLGLFGLASFTAEQKTKEIGIRKVLGASVGGIIMLFSREFTKWVAIASVIAFPVAYFTIQDWLGNFVYRTDIPAHTFIVSGIVALLIALLTVSYQSIRAALSNPVDALHYE
jgi:putative ABC transport system permease protein